MNINKNENISLVEGVDLIQPTQDGSDSIIVYEVNLVFNKDIYEEKKEWMLQHIEEMVEKNNFLGAHIQEGINLNPLDDNHLRKHSLTVNYYIASLEELKKYLYKNARNMRNEVIENFSDKYTVHRRAFILRKKIIIGKKSENFF